jgi:hypothetical protein
MRNCLSILFIFALSAPPLTSSQDKASNDLNTLLRDASYVFNRFDEISAATEIDHYPVQIRKSSKDALAAILINVDNEKPALNALLSQSKVSSVDLLDVYGELVEVAAELESESSGSLNWGDPKLAVDFATLSSKAAILAAGIGVRLKSQIATQESQLALCKLSKPRS